jgi:hypothetical protein
LICATSSYIHRIIQCCIYFTISSIGLRKYDHWSSLLDCLGIFIPLQSDIFSGLETRTIRGTC